MGRGTSWLATPWSTTDPKTNGEKHLGINVIRYILSIFVPISYIPLARLVLRVNARQKVPTRTCAVYKNRLALIPILVLNIG